MFNSDIRHNVSIIPDTVVQGEIMFHPELNSNEKLLFSIISSCSSDKRGCCLTNSALGYMLGVNPVSVSKMVSKLVKMLLIRRLSFPVPMSCGRIQVRYLQIAPFFNKLHSRKSRSHYVGYIQNHCEREFNHEKKGKNFRQTEQDAEVNNIR